MYLCFAVRLVIFITMVLCFRAYVATRTFIFGKREPYIVEVDEFGEEIIEDDDSSDDDDDVAFPIITSLDYEDAAPLRVAGSTPALMIEAAVAHSSAFDYVPNDFQSVPVEDSDWLYDDADEDEDEDEDAEDEDNFTEKVITHDQIVYRLETLADGTKVMRITKTRVHHN